MNQSPKNLIKVLEAKGWIMKRINGSYHLMYHPERKQTMPIPVHGNKDIPLGLFLSILKRTDTSMDEL
ncbi:type II toxin-antitoxin system HicA family toxin [Runella sp.]|jgi:predicted RNA binding protein YcfA (HicA-like mRNA interferase family)|uniref:type II toxin-antitoxin system HicA family toxin n=1 Tax=Runella sp. TaxID=1960881 RepID=UPI0026168685|nr:type II toxin-antitoxin system HicA family toxin [Runella sp.]